MMLLVAAAVLLLGVQSAGQELQSGRISQRELRSLFVHHQAYCRDLEDQTYASLAKHHCEASPRHVWFRDESSILPEDQFHQRHLDKRAAHRRLSTSVDGAFLREASSMYLARVDTRVTLTSELRSSWERSSGVEFEAVLRGAPTAPDAATQGAATDSLFEPGLVGQSAPHYLTFFAASHRDVDRVEQLDGIVAVLVLPSEWKISPALWSRAAHDSESLQPGTRALKLNVANRARDISGGMRKISAIWQGVLRAAGISGAVVQTGVEDGLSHHLSPEAAAAAEDAVEWIQVHSIPVTNVSAAAELLASQPETARIEPELLHVTNNAYSRWVTQSYARDGQGETRSNTGRSPVWEHGIRGENQIVGVGDSGLAHKSCFFIDSARPIGNIQTGTTFSNANHRKVVQYAAFADGTAGEDGDHGTHVSGSVAGKATSTGSLGEFDGMAPEARLAFFDIGIPNQAGLRVPNDLGGTMFTIAYQAGARIHTNSWGARSSTYSANARSVDRFMFDNQDFLVLFAAGNSGGDGPGSVGTPATSKSCVAVGASQSTSASFAQNGRNCANPPGGGVPCTESMASFSSIGPIPADSRVKPDVAAPGFYTWSALSNTADTYTCPAPGTSLTDQQLEAHIVAFPGTSMATPTTAGNAALIRQYFLEGWYPRGRKGAGSQLNPMGALLKAVLVNSGKAMLGEHGNTALTPGGPSNTNPAASTTNPNIQLIRSTPPYATRIYSGFGLTILNRSISFADAPGLDFFVAGNFGDMGSTSVITGQERSFSVTVPANAQHPLKITLAWSDPPPAAGAQTALVNDLDLVVTNAAGQRYVPNGFQQTEVDSINPLEQVEIYAPAAGTYSVKVVGRSVVTPHPSTGGQPYALVISGSFAKDSSLFAGEAPSVTPAPSQKVVSGRKNSFVIVGSRFSGVQGGDTVELFCGDDAGPLATVLDASATGITIETSDTWPCTGTSLNAIVSSDGFNSGPTKVQVAQIVSEASVDVVVGEDGVIQIVPESSEEKQSQCAGLQSSTACTRLVFCSWNGSECNANSDGPSLFVILAGVGIGLLLCACLLCALRWYRRRQDQGDMGPVAATKKPAVATTAPVVKQTEMATEPSPRKKHVQPGQALKPGWKEAVDPSSGDTYYYNPNTGETTWERHLVLAGQGARV